MACKVYDPGAVVMFVNGIAMRGYGQSTFITATQNVPTYRMFVGTSGEATRALTNNRSGRIEVTLQQSSFSNSVLSFIHATDFAAPRGVGVSAVQIKDLTGNTLLLANTTWIVQYPDVTFSRGVENWTWTLETDVLVMSVGGSLTM